MSSADQTRGWARLGLVAAACALLGIVASSVAALQPAQTAAIDLVTWMKTAPAGPYVVAARPGAAITADYFGLHLHRLEREHTWGPRTPWPDLPVGALRLWDSGVRWADMETARGRWDFWRMDAYLEAAQRAGAKVIYPLGSTPRWASARPDEPCPYGLGCAAEPRDLADWDEHVRRIAQRYRGRIAFYEVWNEPHPRATPPARGSAGPHGFYTGNWASLMAMTQRAHAVLQQVDPQARLLSPAFDGSPQSLDQFLRLGGAAWVEGVSFHYYGADDRHVIPLTRALRSTMAAHGLSGRPLLNSESSFGAPEVSPQGQAPSEARATALTLRALILGAFAGVDLWVHHAWDNQLSGMVRPDGQPRPRLAAYRAVQGWLIGLEPLGCRETDPGTVACLGRRSRPDGPQHELLVWRSDDGVARPLRLPAGWALVSSEVAGQGAEPGQEQSSAPAPATLAATDVRPLRTQVLLSDMPTLLRLSPVLSAARSTR